MKEMIINTLYKSEKKSKKDPNNNRAITMSSVFLKLFKRVIVDQLKTDNKLMINKLQGGFQEKMGCIMTSFAFRECLHFSKENHSKLYVCFLDSRQAFDRVWHDGLFYKLWQLGVNKVLYKSILSMYDGIKSKVRFRDHISDWVHILQGTKQGGVSSPLLYLVYINALLEELESSKLGFCVSDIKTCSPTVADDMVLISFSKNGLQNMLDICYRYSCKWRYEYNPNKCGVIVFNESKADFTKCNRKWSLGPNNIKEMESYTHLGIEYCRSVSIEHNVTN